MKKHEYIKPGTKVVMFQQQEQLLAGSNRGVGNVDVEVNNDNNYWNWDSQGFDDDDEDR